MSRKYTIGLAILGLILSSVVPAEDAPLANANGETLQGIWAGDEGNIAAFLGVPFAAPPVGDLRWRAPHKNQPREGLQKADEFAPACMQGPHITNWYAGVAKAFGANPDGVGKPNGVSEDCLYLNIWTPDLKPNKKLPVMVWVHGGSNKGGWSYEPNYIGDRLAARGVVVVSITYRLGPFGFFSHPALDNGPGEPIANFGWLDGTEAFRWVNKHISAFGGDPENITAIGESSGAGNIGDIIVGEISEEGLYQRLIIQSSGGSLTGRRSLEDEQAIGEKIVRFLEIEELGLDSDRLRQIPPEDLVRATYEALPGHYFDVVTDGVAFVRRPIERFNSEAISGVEMLIGTNADEWYMYIDEGSTEEDLDAWLAENAPQAANILRNIVQGENDVRGIIDRLSAARDMLCPSHYIAARVAAAGGKSWVYHFTRQRPGPGGEKLGVYHGTEIGYVFNKHEYWQSTDEIDEMLTEAVMDYWVQFARTGDPNVDGRVKWPAYSAALPLVMSLGETIGAVPAPDADLCLWLGPTG